MKYPNENENTEEENIPPNIMESPMDQMFYDHENALIKHLTQRQPIRGIIENEFLKKYRHRIMFSGKEKSTAFMEHNAIVINFAQLRNLNLMESMPTRLQNLLWSTVFDNMDLMVSTQGQKGNMVKALITRVTEFKDTSNIQQPKSIKDRLWGNQNNQQTQENR